MDRGLERFRQLLQEKSSTISSLALEELEASAERLVRLYLGKQKRLRPSAVARELKAMANASTQPAMVSPLNLSCNAAYVTMQFTVRLPSVISNPTPAKDAAKALSFNRVKGIKNRPIGFKSCELSYRVADEAESRGE
jgi:hypothetical protein